MNRSHKDNSRRLKKPRKSSTLMPALVVAGGVFGLATAPASALELGEVQVNSALGQPLRASIAYALNPTEQIHSYCIYLRSGTPTGDLPTMSDARISVTGDRINVTGNTPIREPLLSMQVVVDCAYTPHLLREYMLMIDPSAPRVVPAPVVVNASDEQLSSENAREVSQSEQSASQSPNTSLQPNTTFRLNSDVSPIPMNSRYRVQRGDTISTIVARVENRSIGLWVAIDTVFAANKDAFINQDVNRLMADYELVIPSLVEASDSTASNSPAASTNNIESSVPAEERVVDLTSIANTPPATVITEPLEAEDNVAAPAVVDRPVLETVSQVTEQAVTDQTVDLRPGDVVFTPVDTQAPTLVTNEIVAGESERPAPIVNTTSIETGINNSWNWLIWLGGAGVALILGLLFFGRSLKDRFGFLGGGVATTPARRREDDPTVETKSVENVDVDYDFEDTINAEAISLDADLGAGTGLDHSESIIVAEVFDFTASGQKDGELDFEIPAGAAEEPEESPTDIIPPNHREEITSILEKEETPVDEDEEYDMSMIVDATRQTLDEFDATAKDLQAVQVSEVENDDDDSEYTINSAVDIQSLEQDYEDELTATQVANAEIERIAAELANRLDEDESGDETNEMPVANAATEGLSGADLTAEMQGPDVTKELPQFDLPSVSDSDVTAELTANLPTSVEAENDSDIMGAGSEATVEMSAAGSDITVEMQVESGKVDTKKK